MTDESADRENAPELSARVYAHPSKNKKIIARRRLALIGLCALVACGGGCKKLSFPQADKSGKSAQDAKADIPGAVRGNGWHLHWKTPDPKHPGKSLSVLDADAVRGEMADADNDDTVLLHDVRATLYRNGKRAAYIIAPTVTASQHNHDVQGDGGVTVSSLTDPPDTVVTADHITWNVRTGKIVAVGNAKVTRLPKGKGTPITQTGQQIDFDTKLKDFVIH